MLAKKNTRRSREEYMRRYEEKKIPNFSVYNAHPKLFSTFLLITFDLPLIPF
jgi:hypothetical protein